MEVWQAQILYKNSFMKFSKTIQLKLEDRFIDVHKYLIDKRFTNSSLEELKQVFSKCKIKEDDYWYILYSSIPLNNDYVYSSLSSLGLLISLRDFIELVR